MHGFIRDELRGFANRVSDPSEAMSLFQICDPSVPPTNVPTAPFRFRKTRSATKNQVLYETFGQIGVGTFGVVEKCVDLVRGHHYAIKTINPNPIQNVTEEAKKAMFMKEVEDMKKLKHEHIAEFIHVQESAAGRIELFLFLYEGDLSQLTPKLEKPLPDFKKHDELDRVHVHCLLGLQYLKTQNLVHRDIKPANILWKYGEAGTKHFCLADFGLMKEKRPDDTSTFVGSPFYIAPEVELGGTQTTKVDIFSLGMVLLELGGVVVRVQSSRKRTEQLEKAVRIPALQDFRMIHYNPKRRWSVEECLKRLETDPLPRLSCAPRNALVKPTGTETHPQIKLEPTPALESFPSPEPEVERRSPQHLAIGRHPEQARTHFRGTSPAILPRLQPHPEVPRALRQNKPRGGPQYAGISKPKPKPPAHRLDLPLQAAGRAPEPLRRQVREGRFAGARKTRSNRQTVGQRLNTKLEHPEPPPE